MAGSAADAAAVPPRFDELKAIFLNATLKRSPECSKTDGLASVSRRIMDDHGVEVIRAVDHQIATGVWPDMTQHGAEIDDWPAIFEKVLAAGRSGSENDFTNRNTTYNLLHLATLLKAAGGVPTFGNRRSEWDAGCAPDQVNPEHR